MTAIPPNANMHIGCCICLQTRKPNEPRTLATTLIAGYAVCDRHIKTLSQPFSDFAELLRRAQELPRRVFPLEPA